VGQPIEINGVTYDIKKILGRGGLSIVYSARFKESGVVKKAAIKEYLYTQFYDPYTHTNDCEVHWENEVMNTQAQVKSGLKVMNILDYEKRTDLQTPEFYIVLENLKGQTFLDFYRDFVLSCRGLENLDLSSVVRYIFIPLAELLDYCHSVENIVHRDFSVSNIMIQKDEDSFWPILIDWGISKYVGPEWIFYTPKPFITDEMPKDIPVNQKGAPPEIRNGIMPVAASDIYYLGHLMYFIFTGGIMREDSEINDPEAFVLKPKDLNWYVPDSYNEVVIKLTQFEPADRPKNMKVVIKMLQSLIQIRDIHYDFELLMGPDTDPLTGERLTQDPSENENQKDYDEKLKNNPKDDDGQEHNAMDSLLDKMEKE
jgi:serine/threonine protein kinase